MIAIKVYFISENVIQNISYLIQLSLTLIDLFKKLLKEIIFYINKIFSVLVEI